VLKPGGRFCFCEWESRSKLQDLLNDLLRRRRVTDPSPSLAKRRQMRDLEKREGRIFTKLYYNSIAKVKPLLKGAGFKRVQARRYAFLETYPNSEEFIDLFFAQEKPEYSSMPRRDRERFKREALSALRVFESSGKLRYNRSANFYMCFKPQSSE
jgi:hypothetical protein